MSEMSKLDLGRLRMSVGWGTNKKGRPLSPVEVGRHIKAVSDSSPRLNDALQGLQIGISTSQSGRFLRILELPPDIQHLIGWGSGKDYIGFTTAFELTRIRDKKEQHTIADAVLECGLSSKEVLQIAQLRKRSEKSIQKCLDDVLKMRPKIEKRYVFIGSIVDKSVVEKLSKLLQTERDSLLKDILNNLSVVGVTSRLGDKIFTLVGGERFNRSMNSIGKNKLEDLIRSQVESLI
ncbi:MAG: hypothetical protein ACR2NQ_01025 [Thermodesulfobacteriota bacterium]